MPGNESRPPANDNPRRGGSTDTGATPKYAAFIVIAALLILAFQAGIFKSVLS